MNEEVKRCVDAKTDFFEAYFTIPDQLQGEVNDFINETKKLGESCQSGEEFENKFVSTGLSDRFNALIPKCKPKSRKMTRQEKQQSKEILKEMITDNKEALVKDALSEAASRVVNDARDEQLAKNRERMIEEGTFDDYTIQKNRIEGAESIFRFLGSKFKKKKDK